MQVTVPESSEPGDTLTLTVVSPTGSTVTVSGIVPLNWNGTDQVEMTLPNGSLGIDGTYYNTVTVTDAAGNVSAESNTASFILEQSGPSLDSPVIAVSERNQTYWLMSRKQTMVCKCKCHCQPERWQVIPSP